MMVVLVPLLMNDAKLIVLTAPEAMSPKEGACAVSTGAVLAVTVSEAVSAPSLKAVVPPCVLTSTLLPAVPRWWCPRRGR